MHSDASESLFITVDVDWAPDFAIDYTAALLKAHSVRSTWLVTHRSEAIDRLRSRPDLFELGIHPNFAPGSTQGRSIDEVLTYCVAIVPDARSIRTHRLIQSEEILQSILERTAVRVDLSILRYRVAGLTPFHTEHFGRALLRLPTYWEDDVAAARSDPCWDAEALLVHRGLKVFDFHPMHVYLNTRDLAGYARLRDSLTDLTTLDQARASVAVARGPGTGTLLREMLAHPAAAAARRVSDLMIVAPEADETSE